MALTNQEKTQLAAIITREGGLAAFTGQVQSLQAANAQAAAIATLTPVIMAAVQDWPALSAYVGQATNAGLYQIVGAITADVAARDRSRLGPLLGALYGAVKAHLSV